MTHTMTTTAIADLDDAGMAAWDQHKPDGLVNLFAEDGTMTDDGAPEPLTTKDAIRGYVQSWFTAFPDMRTRTLNRVIGDDSVAAEIEFTGTNTGPLNMGGQEIPATGKAITGHGCYFAKVRDGKIVEFHAHPDGAGMMMQLGLIGG